MKKLISLLITLCFTLSILKISAYAQPATNTFKEGIYYASVLNLQPNKIYTVQNVSSDANGYIILLDENQNVIQYLKLLPNSVKQNLLPIKPNYRFAILGNATIYIS